MDKDEQTQRNPRHLIQERIDCVIPLLTALLKSSSIPWPVTAEVSIYSVEYGYRLKKLRISSVFVLR